MIFPVTDLAAFVAYALTMSITPGPNNTMLATMGAQSGWRSTLPTMAGVVLGFFLLIFAAGLGLGALLQSQPGLQQQLAWAGAAYMAFLAWKMWSSGDLSPGEGRPAVGFWGAVALQAVNAKGLVMAITVASSFLVPGHGLWGAFALALAFEVVGAPCMALWVWAGDRLRNWLKEPGRYRAFMRTMALLLVGTAASMLA